MQNPIGEADLEWILHRNGEGTEQLRDSYIRSEALFHCWNSAFYFKERILWQKENQPSFSARTVVMNRPNGWDSARDAGTGTLWWRKR